MSRGNPNELIWSETHDNEIGSIAVSPDGTTVAVGEYKVTYIHHLYDGSLVNGLVHEHTVDDVAFSSDGTFLGAGQGFYGVMLSDVTNGGDPRVIGAGHDSRLSFSSDDLYMAAGNREGIVSIWKLDDLSQVATFATLRSSTIWYTRTATPSGRCSF